MTTRPESIEAMALPARLAERIRPVTDRPPRKNGAFILYWMRTAVRAHDNPALDTALVAADRLNLPVFVYHALSENYPFASDRHHLFVLQGAADVQLELRDRGVGCAFHLERPGHRGPHLRTLAGGAALVVTEEMPVRPLRQWTERLARAVPAPVWMVDSACVVPMRLVGKPYDRAFAYRRATERLRRDRVGLEWPAIEVRHPPFTPDLPFDPVDLDSARRTSLVAECDINHTIGPVPHTQGGSTAGYLRWEHFKREALARYAAERNDPLRDAVSRMSPYLHYGFVSPFRLAREVAAQPGDGPRKFLDELLVWRELAYTFCLHHEDHDSPAALPDWARATLEAHQVDPRPALFSWETLARARTGDPLWDAAQRSLRIHGELHNNVRMTWGKALLNWTADAGRALQLLIDLNHRYALDGRDPSSYGGILWCLGQFDRPFDPERPILGSVRPRPTEQHAARLDVERYGRRTARPAGSPAPRVAIIGAGVSGLICARTLVDHGLPVAVFDKGLRPGGRLATRKAGVWEYDHGAQYFTVNDPRFERWVGSWLDDGLVAEWNGRLISVEGERRRATSGGRRRYVGVPGMNSIAAHLARDCSIRSGVQIRSMTRRGREWYLQHEATEEGPFDVVVAALPAPQAVPLLRAAPRLQREVERVRMHGCWTVMLAFASPLGIGLDGAFVNAGPLSWIARNGSKPARRGETWVLHASNAWTERHLDSDRAMVSASLIEAFREVVQVEVAEPSDLQVHRWRFASPEQPLQAACLFDTHLGLAVCGDWCGGPKVEGAFLSGSAAAGRVLGWMPERHDD